eukprot:1192931-Prorocentrum_minimum.AAC.11
MTKKCARSRLAEKRHGKNMATGPGAQAASGCKNTSQPTTPSAMQGLGGFLPETLSLGVSNVFETFERSP